MPKPALDGYVMRNEVTRAINANQAAREALRRMVDGNPSRENLALLAVRVATALGDNLDALQKIDRIITDNRK